MVNGLRLVAALIVFAAATTGIAWAQQSGKDKTPENNVIQIGEEIEYEVSYLGISLGKIKITADKYEVIDGDSVVACSASILSSPGIPFVKIKVLYKSWIEPGLRYTHKFQAGEEVSEGVWEYGKYDFDYDNNRVVTETGRRDSVFERKVFKTNKKWNDGLSLFFLARRYLYANSKIGVPTLVREDTSKTVISFVGERENVEIDAVEYPIRTVYFKGSANWTGVYGVTGDFEGWFSDDAARVPIKAKMKVYLGSVNIELIKWKRPGWKPPAASGK